MAKYGNEKQGKYDSKKEAKRAAELQLLEKAGKVKFLEEQPKFTLIPSQRQDGKVVERAVTYTADFQYYDVGNAEWVVEDVKSKATITPQYVIKRKLMLWINGIAVREV